MTFLGVGNQVNIYRVIVDADNSTISFPLKNVLNVFDSTKSSIYGFSNESQSTRRLCYGEYAISIISSTSPNVKNFYFNDWVLNSQLINEGTNVATILFPIYF